jgi:hypothetical protein
MTAELRLEGVTRNQLLDAVDAVAMGVAGADDLVVGPGPPVVYLVGTDGQRCAAIVQADVGDAAERAWDDQAAERAAECVTPVEGGNGPGVCGDSEALHRFVGGEEASSGRRSVCSRMGCGCQQYTPRGAG